MEKKCQFLLVLLLLTACNDSNKNESIKPSVKDISEFVYASFNIIPNESFQCKSPKTGIIENIYVKEGQKVKKDQLLFTIRHTADLKNRLINAEINLRDAKDNLEGSNSTLKSITVEIDRLREKKALDSINYERKMSLWKKGVGSKNDLEQTKLNFQNSKSLLKNQKFKYNQTQNTLRSKYEVAQNKLALEKELINDFEIKSEIGGTVFKMQKEEGELITPQEIFAEIGSSRDYKVNMNIDEIDISKIELGDTAIVSLEAYPDEIYVSTLSSISDTKDNITQTFEVEADFITTPKKLFRGLSGEANILISRRKNALVIPPEYLVDRNKVRTEKGLTTVKLGVKTLEYVEILDGIDSTHRLLKPEIK